ncbi:MAG: GH92 family glycosyl hydrolase [Phycisphaerae bacterium]|nr:GH92 family glycosyl hydrolase [Phycisphaerae bacterium]
MHSLVSHVDPFIGVDGNANCLPGPYLPHSIVRLGPDTKYPQKSSGYDSAQPIVRFTHTHVSGTGGGGRYGNVGVTPFVGPLKICTEEYDKTDEQAGAGYYTVTLVPAKIRVELTSTPRVGRHVYHFPVGVAANLQIDTGAVIQVPEPEPKEFAYPVGGYLEVISPNEVIGRCDLRGGWGHIYPYSVFFFLRSSQAIQKTLLANNSGVVVETDIVEGIQSRGALSFGEAEEVSLDVGVSFVSVAQARASVERESLGRTFQDVRRHAEATWESWLRRIRVHGGTDDHKKLFYTSMTRLLCMPTDLGFDDENPYWRSDVRHYTDYYCLWDSVRNANSLISLFAPELEAAMLMSLLDVADHIGWLPDAWIAGHSAQIQGGSSADILFCEAALKGIEGIDYTKALRQMRKNAESESPDPFYFGRHLAEYRDRGFLTTNVPKSCVSRHIEYAYQDWCIGRLAEHLGDAKTAATFYESSQKLWNLWREDIRCFAPKRPDGKWVASFDQDSCLPDSWYDPYFYEGTGRQWSFCTHHDFAGLVARHGGAKAFVEHLDAFFRDGRYHSKEFMVHVPYLYIYAGRPDKASRRAHECLRKYFRATRDGLSDNEDMGCQSAWFMCSAMGLYPVMGQDLYLLTSPLFERTEIRLGRTDHCLVIEAPGAEEGRFIQSASLDGRPLDRAWIRHEEIKDGATLRLELSETPTAWGATTPPPSPLEIPRRRDNADVPCREPNA